MNVKIPRRVRLLKPGVRMRVTLNPENKSEDCYTLDELAVSSYEDENQNRRLHQTKLTALPTLFAIGAGSGATPELTAEFLGSLLQGELQAAKVSYREARVYNAASPDDVTYTVEIDFFDDRLRRFISSITVPLTVVIRDSIITAELSDSLDDIIAKFLQDLKTSNHTN